MPNPPRPEKHCETCGRAFAWRKKWERDWDRVKHCSDACRRTRRTDRDAEIERAIVALVGQRGRDASICPSEAARTVAGDEGFREAMPRTLAAARRLAARGAIEFTQGGRVVDPARARGPVRLRRPRT
jgi:hypothetical protein